MKGNHFVTRCRIGSIAMMAMVAILLSSCAVDGYDDDERFDRPSGIALEAPNEDSIIVIPAASGSSQTISWPVVFGAGGYYVSLYDVSDPDNPVAVDSIENKLVDGNSIVASRAEDVNYQFVIKTAANASLNNAESASSTIYSYSTFTPTYAEIPDGTDLTTYFAENPLPADKVGTDLCFNLVEGGSYTMSGPVDPGLNSITIRCMNKNNRPKVTFTGTQSGFLVNASLALKNINFDCASSESAFVAADTDPVITDVRNDNYFLEGKINIQSCNIDNVCSYFGYDSRKKVYIENFLVNNCIVHLTPAKTLDGVFWFSKGGNILNLSVSNSTFYETGSNDYKYFYQSSGRAKNINYASNTTSYTNSTFYNVCNKGQWGNYNSMAGQSNSYWVMTDCIFWNCSPSGVARRFLAGRQNQKTATFSDNTYIHADGTFDSPSGYDNSGTDIKEDPQFKNPDNGDFTISGTTQVSLRTGDPRWLPSAK